MTILSPRITYWIKTIGKFVSVQLIVQGLGIISGIFLVRFLDKSDYGYYTIALAMQATMNLLADMGISIGISAIGGQVWQDKYRFGQLIKTAMQLRYNLAVISVAVVTPISIWMLIKNGASLTYAILITLVVLVGLNFQLTNTVLLAVPRLHSQINRIQNLDLLTAVSKIILLGVAYLTFLNGIIAMATASISMGLQRWVLGYWVTDTIDFQASTNQADRKFILRKVRDLAPNGIFFCIQGQLTVWLMSIFGNVEHIAEAGALGRVAIIFSLVDSVMTSIIVPNFTKCHSLQILRQRYFQSVGVVLVLGLSLLGITALFPNQVLWIFGSQYSHLQNELILMMVGAVFTSTIGTMWMLNAAKAWVEYVWVEIPLRIVWQIILILLLDLSTVKSVIVFGILSNISPFLVNACLTYRGLKKLALGQM